ncbi:MAG: lipoprotein insertase outer membrane protein LolB [Pseudomarimonas sp.]
MISAMRWLGVLGLMLALVGCRTMAPRTGDAADLMQQASREAQIAQVENWSLVGRLAVSNGDDGGSGNLRWVQGIDDYELEVQAPVTRQTWRLQVKLGLARLEGLDGGPHEDADAEALLAREVGWVLPLADLASWVRGARGDGESSLRFAEDGLPFELAQHGWIVEYRGWNRKMSPPMPTKIFAQRGKHRVRLLITRWHSPDAS